MHGVNGKLIYWTCSNPQARRNRKSRTASMEIEAMKEITGQTDPENMSRDPEGHISETTHA